MRVVVVSARVLALAALVFTVVTTGACDSLRTVDVPVSNSIDVPGRAQVGQNPLAPSQVFSADDVSAALKAALNQTFSTQGTNKAAVDSMKVTKFTVTAKDAVQSGHNVRGLGMFKSLTLSVANDNTTPVVVATSPAGAFDGTPGPDHVDLTLTGAELATVLKAGDNLKFSADLQTGDPPNFGTTVTFDTTVTVVINPIGAVLGGGK
jgi:hypothetical protein